MLTNTQRILYNNQVTISNAVLVKWCVGETCPCGFRGSALKGSAGVPVISTYDTTHLACTVPARINVIYYVKCIYGENTVALDKYQMINTGFTNNNISTHF